METLQITKEFSAIKDKFIRLESKREGLEDRLSELKVKKRHLERREKDAEKALVIIQEVAQKTQKNLEFHISNLVTTAIQSVDPEWPEFVAKIVIRRNATECDLLFREFDVEQKPKDCSGGGVKDVASFALRVSYWSLRKNRPTFILDEPFRNVSPDLQEKVSDMIKMISDKLKVQILMVSHAEDINIAADKTFINTKKGKIAHVTET